MSRLAVAAVGLGLVGLAGAAQAEAALPQPAHPARVAEALLPAVDRMLVEVFEGPARVRAVDCYADTVNGRQKPYVACELTFRGNDARLVSGTTVEGWLGTQRCRIKVYETLEGCIRVPTMNRGVWYYHFAVPGR